MRIVARAVAVTTTTLLVIGFLPGLSFAATGPQLSGPTSPPDHSFTNGNPTTVSATFDAGLSPSSTFALAGPAGFSCPATPPANSNTLSCTPTAVGAPGTPLPEGLYQATYNAVAFATGGGSTSGQFTFTIDRQPPGVAVGVAISPDPYTASNLSAGTPIVVTFQAEQSSVPSVSLSSTGGGSPPNPVVATETATPGNFTASFANTINDGTLTARVVVTDRAGNSSGAVLATSLKDTSAPAILSSTPGQGGFVKSGSAGSPTPYDVLANEALSSASTVVLTDSVGTDVATDPATLPTTKTVRVTPTFPLTEGNYTAKITLVDTVGNTASTVTRTFTVDNTAPATPGITTPTKINNGNQATYTVGGTGEPHATVQLTLTGGATVPATTTVDDSGNWTTTNNVSTLTDGPVSLSATQTDRAGNASVTPATASITKDTVIPRVTLQHFNTTTYNATQTTATVIGKVDDGATTTGEPDSYTVSIDDTDPSTAPVTATGTAAADGTFTSPSMVLTSLKDGVLTATVVATDGSGNPSAPATATAQKDTGAPATPTVIVTNPINSTNVYTVDVHGVTEKSASVTITINDTDVTTPAVSRTVTADPGTGAYSASPIDLTSPTLLKDGTLTVSVVATDAFGNPSNTATVPTTLDTVAPVDPTLVVPVFASHANYTAVPVSGTGEVGSTVTPSANDGTTTLPVQPSVTVKPDGTWSALLDVHTLAEGPITITAVSKDAAGNLSGTTSKPSTKDTVAPGVPATLAASPAPYVYANRTADLTVGGADATPDRSASDLVADMTLTDGVLTLTATGVPVAVTTGAFSHAFPAADVATLKDGTLALGAVIRDPAGNVGPPTTSNVLKDTTKLVVLSTTPAALINSAPSTSGTFNEALNTGTSTVTVKNGGGNGVLGSLAFGNGGKTVTFTPSSSFTEQASPYTVQIHGVDVNDAADQADSTFTFTVDTTPPIAPVYVVPTTITKANQAAYVVNGTGEAGATLHLTLTGGATLTKTTTVLGDGSWTTSNDVTSLTDGPVTLSATQTDVAGNTGPSGGASTTKDTVGAAVSRLTASNTNIANPSTVITGTTEPGATVALTAVDGHNAPVTGPAIVAGDGSFTGSLDVAGLNDGPIIISALATDALGNVGDASSVNINKDTLPPAVTGLSVTIPVNATHPSTTVSGSTTSATDTVVLSATDGVTTVPGTAKVLGDRSFSGSLNLSSLGDGPITVSATPTDAAGNTGTPATTTLSKDGTVPVISGLAATASTSGTPLSTVTGTVDDHAATVALLATDRLGATRAGTATVTSATGKFTGTLDLSTLADGAIAVKATATDAAGNDGIASVATTRATRPGTPAAPTAQPGDRDVEVSFLAPTTFGSPITSYTVTASPGGVTATGESSPIVVSGLANGTDYTFTVTATNAGGTSAASQPSHVVTPLGFSDISLNAIPGRVVAGTYITLAGRVVRTDPAALYGPVSILVQYDNYYVRVVARVTPASDGTFRVTTRAIQNSSYLAGYEGDQKNDGAGSPIRRVLAAVKIIVQRANPTAASTVLIIKGTVGPNKKGREIRLDRVLAGGKLQLLGKMNLASNSAYLFRIKLPKGNYTLQVSMVATPGNLANTVRFAVNRT